MRQVRPVQALGGLRPPSPLGQVLGGHVSGQAVHSQ